MIVKDNSTSDGELTLGANAYNLLKEAVECVKPIDKDLLSMGAYADFSSCDSYRCASDPDLARMSVLVGENLRAFDLIDKAVIQGVVVFPPTAGKDPADPLVKDVIDVLANLGHLHQICHLQSRYYIGIQNWGEALIAINRIFAFGRLLGCSRHDFLVEIYAERAKEAAYSALIELALQQNTGQEIIARARRLLDSYPASAREFIECRLGSFWVAVLAFLDRCGNQDDVSVVVELLLSSGSFRDALTEGKFRIFDVEDPTRRGWRYPVMSAQEDEQFTEDWAKRAGRWITESFPHPFQKDATIAVLEEAWPNILDRADHDPQEFRQFLDGVLDPSIYPSSSRLMALLRAAASESDVEIQRAAANIGENVVSEAAETLISNVVGRALAGDVLYALYSNLWVAWIFWQHSITRRVVCHTILAIIEFSQRWGTLPADLDELVACGNLDRLPRDPYVGNVIFYDAGMRKVWLDLTTPEIDRFYATKGELAWYLSGQKAE